MSGFATGCAIAFDHAGNDLIDASASTAGVTIYGGAGKDTIYGSQGDDQLAGGSGDDEIHGDDNPTDTIDGTSAVGRDHIYGDGGINADLTTRLDLATQIITLVTVPAPATDGASSDGLAPGGDTLFGDGGDDIILGDHGVITQAPGTIGLLTTGMVHRIETTENASGGIDRIQGGAGNDQILGGHMGDFIDGNDGDNIILGDRRRHRLRDCGRHRLGHRPDHQPVDDRTCTAATTTSTAAAATTSTSSPAVAKTPSTCRAATTSSSATATSASPPPACGPTNFSDEPLTLDRIETTAFGEGGNDTITTGAGNDIVLGGHNERQRPRA